MRRNQSGLWFWWGFLLMSPVGGPATAQSPFALTTQRQIPWRSGTLPPGTKFRSAAAAELTGDFHDDALFLGGNTALFVFGPGAHTSSFTHPLAILDLAVMPRKGLADHGIFLVDEKGLQYSEFTYQGGPFTTSLIQGGPIWENAQRLILLDSATGTSVDFVAVTADGSRLLFLYDALGTPTPGSAVSVGGTVLDLCTLDWSGDATHEVAVLTDQGVAVYDDRGAPLSVVTLRPSSGMLQPFRQDGFPFDRLALVIDTPPTAWQTFMVVDSMFLDPPMFLKASEVVGLAAADVDLDGDDDLVLNSKTSAMLVYADNVSDGLRPSGDPTFVVHVTGVDLGYGANSAPLRSGDPVFLDADRDGDQDLLVASTEHEELVLVWNPTLNRADQAVRPAPSVYVHDYAAGVGDLALGLHLPVQPMFGATHVEIVTWRRPELDQAIASPAWARTLHPLGGPSPITVHEFFQEPSVYTQAVYHMQARLVHVDPAGDVVEAGPVETLAFTTDAPTTNALAAQSASVVMVEIVPDPAEQDIKGDAVLGSGLNEMEDPGDYIEDPPDPTPAAANQ